MIEHQTRRRVPPLPPEDRRAAIIAATLPLLEQHGARISTRQIAAAAGVAEGTLFRVFPDKSSLVHASIVAATDPIEAIAALNGIPEDADVRTRMGAIVDVITDRLTRHQRLFAVAREMVISQSLSGEFGQAMQENRERVMAAVVRVIEPDEADLRVSPKNLARLLMALVISARGHMYTEPAPLTNDEIVEVLLDGVLKPHPERSDTKQPGARQTTTKESSC